MRESETVCRSKRSMQIINREEVKYGRRIDLLIISKPSEEGDEDTELCSIEFKKSSVSESVSINQQGKNIRINACILNQNQLVLKNTDLDLTYYDFTGRKVYLAQLFQFDDCYIAHHVDGFLLPKSLLELDLFRQSSFYHTANNPIERRTHGDLPVALKGKKKEQGRALFKFKT